MGTNRKPECDFLLVFHVTIKVKVGLKVWTLAIAPLTWVRLVTSSALQSRKWQLIGMSQWCRSALCGHPLPSLTDNWTHGAASRHTIAPISQYAYFLSFPRCDDLLVEMSSFFGRFTHHSLVWSPHNWVPWEWNRGYESIKYLGYPTVETAWSYRYYVYSFDSITVCDEQTDRQPDGRPRCLCRALA